MLLQQGLRFCSSCQAVGLPLEAAIFSSSFSLQDLQHPRDGGILRAVVYQRCNMWIIGRALALTVVTAWPPVHLVRPKQRDRLLSPPRQSEKPKFPSTAQKKLSSENKVTSHCRNLAVGSKSYLSVYFIDNDIHELIVPFFSAKNGWMMITFTYT